MSDLIRTADPLALEDYEYAYRDTGIILNNTVPPGTPFVDIVKVTGLDTPPIEPATQDKDSGHGGFADARYTGLRTIIYDGTVYTNPNVYEDVNEDLIGEYFPTNLNEKLWIKQAGVPVRYIYCKPLGFKSDVDTGRRTGTGTCQIQFIAEDTRKYVDNADVSGQYNVNHSITNTGKAESFPLFTVNGPCTVNSIRNITWNEVLTFTTGIVVASGSQLILNAYDRSIKLNGVDVVTARAGGSKWPYLHKGAQNLRVDTPSGTAGGSITIATKSAWW